VYCIGDSLTLGFPNHSADNLDWPKKMSNLLGARWEVSDNNQTAIVAQTIAQLEAALRGFINLHYDDWAARNAVIHQGGTNNYWPATNNQEPATGLAELSTSVANSQAAGFEVFVCTIPPIGDAGELSPAQEATFESRRSTHNTSVLAGGVGVDSARVIRWDTSPLNVVASPYYDDDNVHFETAGNDVLATRGYETLEGGGTGDPCVAAAQVYVSGGKAAGVYVAGAKKVQVAC
jgi:hypothetical protein